MTAKRVLVSFAVVLAAAGMFPVASTQSGAHAIAVTQAFLLFYAGVVSLVAFTAAVVWGLLAAERFMPVRYRVLAQGIHRMFGVLGLGFLVTHIVLQILAEHAHVVDAVVPFLDTDDRLVATGLGTISADLMIVVYAVGRLRGRFVNAARPWVWRIVHGIAYLSWPIAIAHGLTAGRPVKGGWVTVSYVVCLLLVVIALLIRLFSPFPAARAARRGGPVEPSADVPARPSRSGTSGERERPPADTGLREAVRSRESGPMPRVPLPRVPRESGPMPRVPRESGPMPRAPRESGPMPRVPRETGPMPRVPRETGPMPRVPRESGPMPRVPRETGPMPRVPRESGPMPRVPSPPASVPPFERVRQPEPTRSYERSRRPEYVKPAASAVPTASATPAAPTPAPKPAGGAAETPRERLLIPDRPGADGRPDEERQPRHWLDAVERFPLLQQFLPRRQPRSRPIVNPDIEEVEFWANLRAETSVWIRRGRR